MTVLKCSIIKVLVSGEDVSVRGLMSVNFRTHRGNMSVGVRAT